MGEKRFICGLGFPINSDDPIRIISDSVEDKDYYKFSDICNVLNEQQDKITELKKNFDDLVNWASEIANRNVVLDEQIGELQRENKQLRKELGDCEKFRYQVFKRMEELL